MSVEQLAEVGLADPSIHPRADLHADESRDGARPAQPRRQIYLAEATLAEQPLDAILQFRFRTPHDVIGNEIVDRV